MANLIQSAKESINELLAAAFARAVEKGQLPAGAALTGGAFLHTARPELSGLLRQGM